jgi:hypothetical protein
VLSFAFPSWWNTLSSSIKAQLILTALYLGTANDHHIHQAHDALPVSHFYALTFQPFFIKLKQEK